jgi:ElaB/YqjD/DUF883 family membrane-anchored ribosome-binding protein
MTVETNTKSEEIEALKRDIAALRSDLKSLFGAVKTNGVGKLDSFKTRLRDRAVNLETKAQENLHALYGRVSQQGHEALDSTRGEVEKRPLTALAGAFVVGLLFGKLSRR